MIRRLLPLMSLLALLTAPPSFAARPNILLITADDLNCDSVGAFGCEVAGTTPNIDRLARSGMRLLKGHVTIAVCQPCRNVWHTGRYPHRSGGEGFHTLTKPGLPILPGILKEHGYRVGVVGKSRHSTPYADFRWDLSVQKPGGGRNPSLYAQHTAQFIKAAKEAGQPFFLMANSHDPHRPFYGNDRYGYDKKDGPRPPSKVYQPGEVKVPGFLPDISQVRKEVAEYYSSVRRMDDTVGAILKALQESGAEDDTIVMFLSDHGMALPFAKTNVYHHSTRSPWIVRWPGQVKVGSSDDEHFVSGVDLLPTLLDLARIDRPEGIDGRSFRPVLEGKPQDGREMVFTQFHQTAARRRYPMRSVETARYRYIYNPWSDGERTFRNESQNGRAMKAMLAAAKNDPQIAARCELFLKRVPEELYDVESDADCRRNLVGDPQHKDALKQHRRLLSDWMKRTGDPAAEPFSDLGNEQLRRRFMAAEDAKAGGRKGGKRKKRNP